MYRKLLRVAIKSKVRAYEVTFDIQEVTQEVIKSKEYAYEVTFYIQEVTQTSHKKF